MKNQNLDNNKRQLYYYGYTEADRDRVAKIFEAFIEANDLKSAEHNKAYRDAYTKTRSDNLPDNLIKSRLKSIYRLENIPEDLIESYRYQLKIKRLLKLQRNGNT